MTGHSDVPYYLIMIFWGGVGLHQMFINKAFNKPYIYVLFFLYTSTSIMNAIVIGNLSLNDLIKNVFLFGITISLFAFPIKFYQGVISFYVTVVIFVYFFNSGALTKELLTSSGNYISVLLILSVCIYYIGLHNSRKRIGVIDIIPSIACFLLSIWAKGRGGVISTGFLLVLVILAIVKQNRKEGTKFYKVFRIAIAFTILILLYKSINLVDEFLSIGKFEEQGFDTPRPFMWASYLSKMIESPIYVFMGAPLNEIPVIHMFENNTHNSFLQLHALNGLVMFVFFFYYLFRAIYIYIRNDNMALLVITLTLVMRGMTDKFIFGQYGMPIMMFLALYPFVFLRELNTNIE